MTPSEDRGVSIFDEEEGISIEIPLLSTGTAIKIYLTDEVAEDLINIIRNKLNARF